MESIHVRYVFIDGDVIYRLTKKELFDLFNDTQTKEEMGVWRGRSSGLIDEILGGVGKNLWYENERDKHTFIPFSLENHKEICM